MTDGSPGPKPGSDRATLVPQLETMMRIRAFETRVEELFLAGQIAGSVHLYIGEEAVATGVCSALRPEDYLTSTHRGHGHAIAKGARLDRMMAELFGRRTGYCKGKGGSMHIADFSVGMLGANGIVAGGLPIAVGAGLSAKMRQSGQVVACFFGDGATSRGTFHEALNMAALFRLPVLFVNENNQYASTTPTSYGVSVQDVASRAAGYGIPGLVIRAPDGIARQVAAQHSQSLEAWFFHAPGMKIVVPSNPADAKGLLKAAIRDDDPVLYCEHKSLYRMKGPVPEGEQLVPLGQAAVCRSGKHATLVSYSMMMTKALEAASQLAREGIEVEVVDLRSLVPLDIETLQRSAQKTKRILVAHEACRRGGVGAEIAATLGEELYDYLDAPVMRVGARDVPMPFSAPMERFVVPQVEDLVAAVRRLMVVVPL